MPLDSAPGMCSRGSIFGSARETTKLSIGFTPVILTFTRYPNQINRNGILVYADKIRIIQVISDLLDNAIKFTKQGTTISIVVSLEERENKARDNSNGRNETGSVDVVVSINNSGLGIDPEIMPRLFTRFATKSNTGAGLGLYICKRIIEAHGGRIWAENNINNGGIDTTFSFSFPLR
jgi:signal transduction histidine kinase